MSTPGIVSQALRAMTVEVRHAATEELQGAAVFVSPTRLLATCAHVVRDCGVDPRAVDGDEVLLRIPARLGLPEEKHLASVFWVPEDAEDDFVLLAMHSTAGAVPPERVAKWGLAAYESDDHRFRSYGFRRRGDYEALFGDGKIVSHVAAEGKLLTEPLQLQSLSLDSGMSGGAVFDVDRNLVVGFVRQVYDPAGTSSKDPDLAWAVDAAILGHSPLRDEVVVGSLSSAPAPAPEVEPSLVEPAAGSSAQDFLVHAPEPFGVFVDRLPYFAALDDAWAGGATRVVALTGLPGEGKTSLAREWVRRLRKGGGAEAPRAVFWWSIQAAGLEVDALLAALITHLSGGGLDPSQVPNTVARANLAAALLAAGRHVVVLDGVENAQAPSGDLAGHVESQGLATFLASAAGGQHASLVVVTTRLPLTELEHYGSVLGLPLAPLSADEGRALLERNGVRGEPWQLDLVVGDWGGHALALTAVAAILRSEHGGQAERLTDVGDTVGGHDLVTQLRALGNRLESGRAPEEVQVIRLVALARGALAVDVLESVAAGALGLEPSRTGKILGRLVDENVCRRTVAGDVLLHPVVRNLYAVSNRLLAGDQLTTIHRLFAENYYRRATGPRP